MSHELGHGGGDGAAVANGMDTDLPDTMTAMATDMPGLDLGEHGMELVDDLAHHGDLMFVGET